MPLVAIPKKLEGMNKSEKYIFNKLKQLYMSEPLISYLYLEPKIKNLTPDFILIDPIRGVIIIEVKAWSIEYIDTVNEKELKTSKGDILENPASKARRYYNTLQGVLRFYDELFDEKNNLKIQLHSVVAFTEMKEEEAIENKIESLFNHYPARVLYKEALTALTLDKLFNNEMKAIESSLLQTIRAAIFPEIKIVHSNTNKRKHFLNEKVLALDIEQERFAKSLPLGHYMITGIPGSGKTVALMARAIYLAKLYPKWKILILTYNKALKSQLNLKLNGIKEDLKYLEISIDNIEVATFHQKAMRFSGLSSQNYRDNSEEFWRDILPNDAIRQAMPTYNAILIDEYQDFYKNWFELVLKLLIEYEDEEGKKYHNLFLAGDRLQSIYNPTEVNWKQDIGLDMRGRSTLLKTSYRVTKEHIVLGLSLLRNDKKYEKEVDVFYEKAQNILLKNMTKNSIELLETNYQGVAKAFEKLLEEYDYADILLLAPTWNNINRIKQNLPYEVQQKISSSKELERKKAIFTTYHSSKGIEAKVAIVVDIDKIRERKLLYVASTRASAKLILHSQNIENSMIGNEVYKMLNLELG
ncbi:MAG: DNA helicase [uncultured Sulfurovum sp.]|uniref:DNA 3'-5' helicase II n=1 Tax=uncultured Sulfurovum sp. TaxID=269237 RepID=A0A6S6S858_9BACT|nr:MAG: DNA helicase [uncultured Sulfurovum sp.]